MNWNINSDRPVFIQIVDLLKLEIIAGRYNPGDKLPSVRDLAMEAQVNPNTMQRAFAELERLGLVYTQRTNGRFITEDKEMIEEMKQQMAINTIAEFLHQMEQLGYSNSDTMKLLEKSLGEGK